MYTFNLQTYTGKIFSLCMEMLLRIDQIYDSTRPESCNTFYEHFYEESLCITLI